MGRISKDKIGCKASPTTCFHGKSLKGNEIALLTNRFDGSADEIAEIYKLRRAIELFFKRMKQHFKKRFYRYNEQNVHNQMYLDIIVYCLNVLAQLNTNSDRSYLQIRRYFQNPENKKSAKFSFLRNSSGI